MSRALSGQRADGSALAPAGVAAPLRAKDPLCAPACDTVLMLAKAALGAPADALECKLTEVSLGASVGRCALAAADRSASEPVARASPRCDVLETAPAYALQSALNPFLPPPVRGQPCESGISHAKTTHHRAHDPLDIAYQFYHSRRPPALCHGGRLASSSK